MALRPALLALLLPALAGVCGCGGKETTDRVEGTTERPAEGPRAPPMSAEERLLSWDWRTPRGWVVAEPVPMRIVGFRMPASPGVECSLVALEGAAGGVLANVNRWRRQMSLPPVGETELRDGPPATFLGGPALALDLEGTYVGMGGDAQKIEGARLLGRIARLEGGTVFLKMTGPAAGVEAERAAFGAFAASVRPSPDPFGRPAASASGARPARSGAGGDPHGDPHAGAPETPPEPAPPAAFAWTVPEGWSRGPEKTMRLATFVPSGAKATEIAVYEFPSSPAADNVNRWRAQVGLGPLTDEQFAALPTATVFGRSAVFVEAEGTYRGMGEANVANATLLGAVMPRGATTVFVKMAGPSAEVAPERARFRAFCESFHE